MPRPTPEFLRSLSEPPPSRLSLNKPYESYRSPDDDEEKSDTLAGFKESFAEVPRLFYGLVMGGAEAIEQKVGKGGMASAVKEYALDKYIKSAQEAQATAKPIYSATEAWKRASENGDYGALVDFTQYWLGYVAGQGVQMVATAGVGSVIAKAAVKKVASKTVESMVAKRMEKLAAEKVTANLPKEAMKVIAVKQATQKLGRIGETAALGAASVGMEGGEIFGDLVSNAERRGEKLSGEDLAKALGWSLSAGALDLVGNKFGVDLILGRRVTKGLAGLTGVGGRVARAGSQAVMGAGVEGATEFTQTLMEQAGKKEDPLSRESIIQAIDAAAVGVLGGTTYGAVGGAFTRPVRPPDTKVGTSTEKPTDTPPPPPPPAGTIPPVTEEETGIDRGDLLKKIQTEQEYIGKETPEAGTRAPIPPLKTDQPEEEEKSPGRAIMDRIADKGVVYEPETPAGVTPPPGTIVERVAPITTVEEAKAAIKVVEKEVLQPQLEKKTVIQPIEEQKPSGVREFVLNIGMDIGDKKDALSLEEIEEEIKSRYGEIESIEVKPSPTENSAIVKLKNGMLPHELDDLADALRQNAIAYRDGDNVDFYGSKKQEWIDKYGKPDRSQFLEPTPKTPAAEPIEPATQEPTRPRITEITETLDQPERIDLPVTEGLKTQDNVKPVDILNENTVDGAIQTMDAAVSDTAKPRPAPALEPTGTVTVPQQPTLEQEPKTPAQSIFQQAMQTGEKITGVVTEEKRRQRIVELKPYFDNEFLPGMQKVFKEVMLGAPGITFDKDGNMFEHGKPLKLLNFDEIRQSKIGLDGYEGISFIAAMHGKIALVVNQSDRFDGLFNQDPKNAKYIFITADTFYDPVAITGHEIAHAVQPLYKVIQSILAKPGMMNPQARRAALERHTWVNRIKDPKLREKLLSGEINSDIYGHAFRDLSGFWPKVFKHMNGEYGAPKAKEYIMEFLEKIKTYIKDIREKARKTSFMTVNGEEIVYKYLNNVEAFYDEFAPVVAKYYGKVNPKIAERGLAGMLEQINPEITIKQTLKETTFTHFTPSEEQSGLFVASKDLPVLIKNEEYPHSIIPRGAILSEPVMKAAGYAPPKKVEKEPIGTEQEFKDYQERVTKFMWKGGMPEKGKRAIIGYERAVRTNTQRDPHLSDATWKLDTVTLKQLEKANPDLVTPGQFKGDRKNYDKYTKDQPIVIDHNGRVIAGGIHVLKAAELNKTTLEIYRPEGRPVSKKTMLSPAPLKDAWRDNPGGEWLFYERKNAAEKLQKNPQGALSKVSGSATAGFTTTLDSKMVAGLPGLNNEQNTFDQKKVDRYAKLIQKGEMDLNRHPVFLNVGYDGKVWINEGNHRARAAVQAGLSETPVEVRYFAGGEEVEGPLNLEQLKVGRIVERRNYNVASPRPSRVDPEDLITEADTAGAQKRVNKLISMLRNYPLTEGTGTNAELMNKLHDMMVDNIKWLYHLVSPAMRERARLWYDGAHRVTKEWSTIYDYTHEQAAAVMAVLSPQADWFNNMTMAERTMNIMKKRQHERVTEAMVTWTKGYADNAKKNKNRQILLARMQELLAAGTTLAEMSDQDAARFVRVFDETYHDPAYRVVTPEGGFMDYVRAAVGNQTDAFDPVVQGDKIRKRWNNFNALEKAVKVLRTTGPIDVNTLSKKDKVKNFYMNIMHPENRGREVTVDTHAVGASHLRAFSGESKEVKDAWSRVGMYAVYRRAYQDAAFEMKLLPREMQSIVWEAIRALFPWTIKKELAPKVKEQWRLYREGKQDLATTRQNIFDMAGGLKPFMWEGGGIGLFPSQGATTYDTEIHEDPAKRKANTFTKLSKKETRYYSAEKNTYSVRLKHYSNVEGLTTIDPNMQGTGQAGAETTRRVSAEPGTYVPRSYYYREDAKVEPRFRGKHQYFVEVEEDDLMDLAGIGGDPTLQEKQAVDDGYIGAYNSEGVMPDAVMLFKAQDVIQPPTVETLHLLAEEKGLEWDDNPDFIALTKEVTGKKHLDDLNGAQRFKMADYLMSLESPAQGKNALSTKPGEKFNLQEAQEELISKLFKIHKRYRWRAFLAFGKKLKEQGFSKDQAFHIEEDAWQTFLLRQEAQEAQEANATEEPSEIDETRFSERPKEELSLPKAIEAEIIDFEKENSEEIEDLKDRLKSMLGGRIAFSQRPIKGSKVRHAVYHGTYVDFDAFELPTKGKNSNLFGNYDVERYAIFFAADPLVAEQFAMQHDFENPIGQRIIKAWINLQNPLDLRDGLTADDFDKITDAGYPSLAKALNAINTTSMWQIFDSEHNGKDNVEAFEKMGYDGVFLTEPHSRELGIGVDTTSFGVFRVDRIKLPRGANMSSSNYSHGHPLQLSPRPMQPVDQRMARAYDEAPLLDETATGSWDALVQENDRLYAEVIKKIDVVRVTGQPYANAQEMFEEMDRGTLRVTTDNSEHPLWDVDQNFKFRAVHDYVGHYEQRYDFSLEGEKAAFRIHAQQISPLAVDALKVEVYGQAAAAIAHNGEFQPQKIFLPPKDILLAPRPPKQLPLNLSPFKPVSYTVEQPGLLDWVIRKLQDKNIDILRMVQAIKQAGGKIPIEANPVLREEMYHKLVAQLDEDFTNDELTPMLNLMRENNVTIEQLNDYLLARHILIDDLNTKLDAMNPGHPDQGKLAGQTDAWAQNVMANTNLQAMLPVVRRVDAILKKTRQMRVGYGLNKQTEIDQWESTYQAYVPLRREGFEDQGFGIGQGRSVRWSGIKTRLGSGREVSNILANIAEARSQVIGMGERSKPVKAFAAMLMHHPNNDIAALAKPAPIMVTNPTTGLPEIIPGDITLSTGNVYKVPMIKTLNKKTGIVESRPDPTYKGRDNVVTFPVDGDYYAIVFNEDNPRAMEIAKAFKNIDTPTMRGILGAVAPYTRYLASVNTQYNPIFGIINFVRDVQFAMLSLQSTPLAGDQAKILRYTLESMSGIFEDARAVRNGLHPTSKTAQAWEQFGHVGGPTGYRDLFMTIGDRAEALENLLNPKKWSQLRTPLDLGRKVADTYLFKLLSDYNTTMENAVRLAVFRAGLDRGFTPIESASFAKNITVNFNKKGQIGAQMGAAYAFFNANVQGTARLAETLFEPIKQGEPIRLSSVGKKIIAGGVLVGVLQAFMMAIAGYEEDDVPEFVKQRSIIIPFPGTDKKYFSMPMPLGFNLIPNIGRLAAETLIGYFKTGNGKAIEHGYNLLEAMVSTFNPMGGTSAVQAIIPSVLDPVSDLYANKDWTGRPIFREDLDRRNPTPGHTRAKDSSTFWAQLISRAINYVTGGNEYRPGIASPTPDAVDFVISQLTGGVGRETSKLAQLIEGAIVGKEVPIYKVPIIGRFVGSASGPAATRDRYYETVKNVNMDYNEFKGRRKAGDESDEFLQSHPEVRLHGMVVQTETQISKLHTKKRTLIQQGAPRDAVKLVEEQITGAMKRVNDEYLRVQSSK